MVKGVLSKEYCPLFTKKICYTSDSNDMYMVGGKRLNISETHWFNWLATGGLQRH